MGPTIVVTFVSSLFILRFLFAKELKTRFDANIIEDFKQNHLIKDKNVLKNSLVILAGVIFFFIIQGYIGIEVYLIAFAGASMTSSTSSDCEILPKDLLTINNSQYLEFMVL